MRWRLLPFAAHRAAMNMAIDEAVVGSVRDGSDPTIRFYSWAPSAVSLGCFQSAEEEMNVADALRLGVDVVRRRTGGGAVFHGEGEITYSVIAPEGLFGRDIPQSYREVCGWIVDALSILGIESRFRPINDVMVQDRKVSGSAQTRREGVLLQHGTVLLTVDEAGMALLTPSPLKRSGGGRSSLTSVSEHSTAGHDEVLAALEESFFRSKEWYRSALSSDELETAARLAEQRYADPGWTFSR